MVMLSLVTPVEIYLYGAKVKKSVVELWTQFFVAIFKELLILKPGWILDHT